MSIKNKKVHFLKVKIIFVIACITVELKKYSTLKMDLLKTINFALKWKIPNFTALAGIESRNFAPMYPYTLPINEQITLQLSLHLNGDLLSRRGYAALILYLIKFPKDNLVINFRASLIDQDGKKRFTTGELCLACVPFLYQLMFSVKIHL